MIALETIFALLDCHLDKMHQAARACAADFGAVLADVMRLPPVFAAFAVVSGLAVRPQMCAVVAFMETGDGRMLRRVGRSLRQSVPEWGKFVMAAGAIWMVVQVGPRAASRQLRAAWSSLVPWRVEPAIFLHAWGRANICCVRCRC